MRGHDGADPQAAIDAPRWSVDVDTMPLGAVTVSNDLLFTTLFDGRVVAALDHRFKSYVGKAAYAGPMLGALFLSACVASGAPKIAMMMQVIGTAIFRARSTLMPFTSLPDRSRARM